uniref:Putative hainantoxin-xiv-7 n=1 Tax=Amblyomma cajennense TaxID=34607 RepID=A0A023FBL2_AMBCJ
MHLASLLFGAHLLMFTAVINHSAAEEDDIVVWADEGGCSSDSDCSEGQCCVGSEERKCADFAGIGQPCSPKNEPHHKNCPCQPRFTCVPKGEGYNFCQAS